MEPNELKKARLEMGLSATDMARALNTPLRTYQDWEAGVNTRMPGIVEVAVTLLGERVKWATDRAIGVAVERINRDFPAGIRSDAVGD